MKLARMNNNFNEYYQKFEEQKRLEKASKNAINPQELAENDQNPSKTTAAKMSSSEQ